MSEIQTQDLGMQCAVTKFVLWFLLPEQKKHPVAVANDSIQTGTNEPEFLTVIQLEMNCGPRL